VSRSHRLLQFCRPLYVPTRRTNWLECSFFRWRFVMAGSSNITAKALGRKGPNFTCGSVHFETRQLRNPLGPQASLLLPSQRWQADSMDDAARNTSASAGSGTCRPGQAGRLRSQWVSVPRFRTLRNDFKLPNASPRASRASLFALVFRSFCFAREPICFACHGFSSRVGSGTLAREPFCFALRSLRLAREAPRLAKRPGSGLRIGFGPGTAVKTGAHLRSQLIQAAAGTDRLQHSIDGEGIDHDVAAQREM
jgi:hypothetical protein